jgi:hypothetical protein
MRLDSREGRALTPILYMDGRNCWSVGLSVSVGVAMGGFETHGRAGGDKTLLQGPGARTIISSSVRRLPFLPYLAVTLKMVRLVAGSLAVTTCTCPVVAPSGT